MNLRTIFATVLVVVSFSIAGCTKETTPPATGTKVSIGQLDYQPKDVSVKSGESVTWENTVSLTHTVTFDDDSMSGKSSGSLNKAGKHSVKFDTVGKFAYHCAIQGHATKGADGKWTGMVGNVTVTA